MKIKKSLQIDSKLHQKLRLYCAINETTISEIVEKSVDLYISKKTNKG